MCVTDRRFYRAQRRGVRLNIHYCRREDSSSPLKKKNARSLELNCFDAVIKPVEFQCASRNITRILFRPLWSQENQENKSVCS